MAQTILKISIIHVSATTTTGTTASIGSSSLTKLAPLVPHRSGRPIPRPRRGSRGSAACFLAAGAAALPLYSKASTSIPALAPPAPPRPTPLRRPGPAPMACRDQRHGGLQLAQVELEVSRPRIALRALAKGTDVGVLTALARSARRRSMAERSRPHPASNCVMPLP